MQGVIFDELEKYIAKELGPTALTRIRSVTGRDDRGYELGATYPDGELTMIVGAVVAETGRQPQVIVEEFGEALVPGLLEVYGFLINPRWSFMDFLLHTEDVVHRGVRLNALNAQPPALQAERAGSDSVAITYRSKRALCALAKGIIRGAATHYGVGVTISEERCILRGDPECVITVSEAEV
jgi:predicted hydrocarbon binding protein